METRINELEFQNQIVTAASWKSELENHTDATYRAFIQVMTYRRDVAEKYLDAKTDYDREVIREIFNHCNKQIKKILGL